MLAGRVLEKRAVERMIGQDALIVNAHPFDVDGVGDDGKHRRALAWQRHMADRILEEFANLAGCGGGDDACGRLKGSLGTLLFWCGLRGGWLGSLAARH